MITYYVHNTFVYFYDETKMKVVFYDTSRKGVFSSIFNLADLLEDHAWDGIIEAENPQEAWEIAKLLGGT